MLAVPFLVYSFLIVNWLRKVVEKIDWKTRKLLTVEGIHHPKAVIGLYIKRWNGGHGLVKLEFTYNVAIFGLSDYIKQGKDRLTRLVKEYDTGMTKYSLQEEANLIKQKYTTQETAAQNIKNQLKSNTENEMVEALKRKPVHGQFYQDNARPLVDKEKPLVWLYCSGFRKKQWV